MYPERNKLRTDTEFSGADQCALNTDRAGVRSLHACNHTGGDQDGVDGQHFMLKTMTMKDASLVQMVHMHNWCDCAGKICEHDQPDSSI